MHFAILRFKLKVVRLPIGWNENSPKSSPFCFVMILILEILAESSGSNDKKIPIQRKMILNLIWLVVSIFLFSPLLVEMIQFD